MLQVAFELALKLGCPHPRRLIEPPWSLTWEDLEDWLVFYQSQPWGERRNDWRNAATVAWLTDTQGQVPGLIYPYWDVGQDLTEDLPAAFDAFESHRRRFHLAA